MIDFLIYVVPWWVWLGLGLVVAFGVARVFGLKPALWILGLIGFVVMLMRARQSGWQDREEKQKQERADAVIGRKGTDDEIEQMGEPARDAEWDRWVRDK